MQDRFLSIYLNDHLAGAMVGVELVRRLRSSNQGGELGRLLDELHGEIEAERETLRRLMRQLDIEESKVKPAGAWLMEKVGRLKLNGQLRGYSPLSRLVELEGLSIGIAGKMEMWRALAHTFDEPVPGFDFTALAELAASQRDRLESHRLAAATIAFSGEPALGGRGPG